MEVEERPVSMSLAAAAGLGDGFTEADMATVDQLVQLSNNISGSGEEDEEVSPSSSLSARSMNNAKATTATRELAKKDGEAGLDRRARKRYGLVSELYAAMRPVKGGGGVKREREEWKNPKDGEIRERNALGWAVV